MLPKLRMTSTIIMDITTITTIKPSHVPGIVPIEWIVAFNVVLAAAFKPVELVGTALTMLVFSSVARHTIPIPEISPISTSSKTN